MKTALVTGASSGIGYEITKLLVKSGYYVLMLARKERDLTIAASAFEPASVKVLPADVTDVGQLLDAAKAIFGQNRRSTLDLIVHSAGVLRIQPHDDLEKVKECMSTNFFGVLNVQGVFSRFLANDSHITIIGSIASKGVVPGGFEAYAASKAAVTTYFENIRNARYSNDGYRNTKNTSVTIAYPSGVETPMLHFLPVRPLVYSVFPPCKAAYAAEKILRDTFARKKESYLFQRDRLLAFLARLTPRTFEKALRWYVERFGRH